MPTKIKLVILMHPKEFKRGKANTGRLASLCLHNSEIHMGICFDQTPRIRELVEDPNNYAVLLFPDPEAIVLGKEQNAEQLKLPRDKQLVFFLFDATWSCAKTMSKENPLLMTLPKVMFQTEQKSRYTIKRQPDDFCLSTLEACHELLLALEKAGLENYHDKKMMISLFDRMQEHQIKRAQRNSTGIRGSGERLAEPLFL